MATVTSAHGWLNKERLKSPPHREWVTFSPSCSMFTLFSILIYCTQTRTHGYEERKNEAGARETCTRYLPFVGHIILGLPQPKLFCLRYGIAVMPSRSGSFTKTQNNNNNEFVICNKQLQYILWLRLAQINGATISFLSATACPPPNATDNKASEWASERER